VVEGVEHPPQRGDPVERLHDDRAAAAPATGITGRLNPWPARL
jgi:hypothetical protein